MYPTPNETQGSSSVSPQEAKDIAQIIDKYPQFAAAKKIRGEREAHFRRLCEEADSQMDACDPGLLLDRRVVYGAVEEYVDTWIEKQVREIWVQGSKEAPVFHPHHYFKKDDGKQKPVEGECIICASDMEIGQDLVWCKFCGVNFHRECVEKWRKSSGRSTCVSCRRLWQEGDNALVTRTVTPLNKNTASAKQTPPAMAV